MKLKYLVLVLMTVYMLGWNSASANNAPPTLPEVDWDFIWALANQPNPPFPVPDPGVTVPYPDDVFVTGMPDGSEVVQNPNGDSYVVFPDGSIVIMFKDGWNVAISKTGKIVTEAPPAKFQV